MTTTTPTTDPVAAQSEPERLTVLHDSYARARGGASTVVLAPDGESTIVIDPGMVRSPDLILEPLAAKGLAPTDVTDVVLSHHHPDHTWHLGLFTTARVHDVWATYQGDQLTFAPAEDPLAAEPDALHAGRRRVLDLAPARIVPAHGPAFTPDASTPR